jgi:predicted short-subunit dehydrogenase-like oxidoreductase (DUF2520 family)
MAIGLAARGYEVEALVARSLSHAQKGRRLVPGVRLALAENDLDKLPESDLVLIATPDDTIALVALKLAAAQKLNVRNRTVLHTSGALSSNVLAPLATVGFHTGSIHPLVSVSEPRAGAVSLNSAFYCLEGDRVALRVGRKIVRDLGGRSFSIDSSSKALYHAAAVMASGHMTALFDIAAEMLTDCGLEEREARRVLLPLVESAWRNLVTSDPAGALTGTFARGDEATVRKHLAALKESGKTEALIAYRLLGRRSLQLLRKKGGGDPAVIRRIEKLLG